MPDKSKSEKQKMLDGELYLAADSELEADRMAAYRWMKKLNESFAEPLKERQAILAQRLKAIGRNVEIRSPFNVDYGYNISIGHDVFINYNCTILDVGPVTIGNHCDIAPNVTIIAADHPKDPQSRNQKLEFGSFVYIGNTVWIGAGALILPGITIGDGAIIGAGSVVTKDVPAGSTVTGNPARFLKKKED